jgi:hypothetical protein
MLFGSKKDQVVTAEEALPGRPEPLWALSTHFVNGTSIVPPFPEGSEQLVVAMGCFWGAERVFWQTPGVLTTAVGYAGGITPNPTYEEVCSGLTGHTEVVLVVFDPSLVSRPASHPIPIATSGQFGNWAMVISWVLRFSNHQRHEPTLTARILAPRGPHPVVRPPATCRSAVGPPTTPRQESRVGK